MTPFISLLASFGLLASAGSAAAQLSDETLAIAAQISESMGISARITAETMGPAAFMWPPGRPWSNSAGQTAPCGSPNGVGNRTTFPMNHGKIALISKSPASNIEVSVSYFSDPKSNTEFSPMIRAESWSQLDPGHTCVPIMDAPPSVEAGSKATLQIKFQSGPQDKKETYYACADITYVELSNFGARIPCFNSTKPQSGEGSNQDSDKDKGKDSQSPGSSSDANASSAQSSGGNGNGLSIGAMAGIVVGCVSGVSSLALVGLLLFRRRQRQQKTLREEQAAGNSKWVEQATS